MVAENEVEAKATAACSVASIRMGIAIVRSERPIAADAAADGRQRKGAP